MPIIHINGFKIGERTIFSCIDNRELLALFPVTAIRSPSSRHWTTSMSS